MKSDFEITNMKEFLNKLNKVKQDVENGSFRAVTKACSFVRRDAKRFCPRSPLQRSPNDPSKPVRSRLKASITYEVNKELGRMIGLVGPGSKEKMIPYARAQEYGYPPRNLPARPYLRPALIKNEQNIKKLFEDVIIKAIK